MGAGRRSSDGETKEGREGDRPEAWAGPSPGGPDSPSEF